jgi:hypothetical protein
MNSERAFGELLKSNNVSVHFWNFNLPNEGVLLAKQWDIIVVMSGVLSEVSFWPNQERMRSRLATIAKSTAIKIVFPQDEYYCSEDLEDIFSEWGVDIISTINIEAIHHIYPKLSQLDTVKFIQGRTVYFTKYFTELRNGKYKDPSNRIFDLSYRAHSPRLPNSLAEFKSNLGKKFESALQVDKSGANLKINITGEVLTGANWISMLSNSRCVLGSNGGSNLIIRNISIVNKILEFKHQENRLPNAHELNQVGILSTDFVQLTAITPRNVEAAALGVAQILVRGSYSNILQSGIDYFEIDEDFKNIKDVMAFIRDESFKKWIASNCWQTILENNSLKLDYLLDAQFQLSSIVSNRHDLHTVSFDTLLEYVQCLDGYPKYFLQKVSRALKHRLEK